MNLPLQSDTIAIAQAGNLREEAHDKDIMSIHVKAVIALLWIQH